MRELSWKVNYRGLISSLGTLKVFTSWASRVFWHQISFFQKKLYLLLVGTTALSLVSFTLETIARLLIQFSILFSTVLKVTCFSSQITTLAGYYATIVQSYSCCSSTWYRHALVPPRLQPGRGGSVAPELSFTIQATLVLCTNESRKLFASYIPGRFGLRIDRELTSGP